LSYYVLIGSEQKGPLTLDQLRGLPLHGDTLVWRQGLKDWSPAATFPEISPMLNPYMSPGSLAPHPASQGGMKRSFKHSGPGLASFVIGILSAVGILGVLFAAGVIGVSNPELADQEDSPVLMGIGFGIIGFTGLALVGGLIGLVGVLQPQRKRIFSILGIIFNGVCVALVGVILAIGLFAV
jgi:hypothetical protein